MKNLRTTLINTGFVSDAHIARATPRRFKATLLRCSWWICLALSPATFASAQTTTGAIQTSNGHYFYAVNGGGLGGPVSGLGSAALNTNRTVAQAWEIFTIVWPTSEKFELVTSGGDFVTAVNGGGVGGPNDYTSPIHTDATAALATPFVFTMVDSTHVTIQTCDGYYLTANDGGGFGGANTVPIHTDVNSATRAAGAWEQFTFVAASCPLPPPVYTSVKVTVSTAGDDARQDDEIVATFSGQSSAMCLKPSNAGTDNWGPGGTSVCPLNSNAPDWGNWTSDGTQSFPLNPGQTAFGTMSVTLIQHPRGLEGWDNWNIQGISVDAIDNAGNSTRILNLGTFTTDSNYGACISRLTNSSGTVTFQLSTNSAGQIISGPNGC